ncbi:hypothetical protein [Actinomadura macra]|uniref:hypothetical protein n=1 Tax=Actinomadura macra TaxID=46164 RepID=UPI00082A0233|nr:hypothetical protein [Actinomadura macra]
MILVLAAIVAVFLAGSACGVFALLVLGIHAEERRALRQGGRSRTASVSCQVLKTRSGAGVPAGRVEAGR